MARKSRNPFGFTPGPVAFFISAVYIALFAVLLAQHHIVPAAPKTPIPAKGINLTEAWHDLEILTAAHRPYNSHRNDDVRDWLLRKVERILKRNGYPKRVTDPAYVTAAEDTPVVLFNDITSNLTFSSNDSALGIAFTGTNIMVYIRGQFDEPGRWWEKVDDERSPSDFSKKGGVLVNAHFDSVSTGFGATDDGVGVVTVLQLISYFTRQGNQPLRGIVALLNNGEEDYLNGAYAFSQHPVAKFPHTFLNLEGAGAGGRARLFRTSDAEVTRFYRNVPYPFASIVSSDGFKAGLVRSETDFSVFDYRLGMRGLDVAFTAPRSRYHTVEDSTKYTTKDSVWHMLSAALSTIQALSSDQSSEFEGDPKAEGKVPSGTGSEAVWFDLFGRGFAVFQLHTLFAISVTLLVVAPILLIGLTILLVKLDKWYPFNLNKTVHGLDESVRIGGLRGFFRLPLSFAVATAAIVGLAFLVTKVNPFIIYSSEYAVWGMMLSAWFSLSWFLLRGADSTRPSALQRYYVLLWMFIGSWVLLVGATISENNLHLSGGYSLVIYFAAVFVAILLSYLEFLALPSKTTYAELVAGSDALTQGSAGTRPTTSGNDHETEDGDDDANERTSLLRGDRQRTYAAGYDRRSRSSQPSGEDGEEEQAVYESLPRPYKQEQAWSGKLPSSIWLLQFLVLGPINLIVVGEVALMLSTSLGQTPSDGNSVLLIYILITVCTVLLIGPAVPFIHRFHYPIPTFLFLLFLGTLGYNLLAFPFSDAARLKVYFVQQVDLDTGLNNVSLTGVMPFTRDIVASIPSAAGQGIHCTTPEYSARAGLTTCSWPGIPPNVAPLSANVSIPPEKRYADWLTFSVSRLNDTSHHTTSPHIASLASSRYPSAQRAASKVRPRPSTTTARFHIKGQNTRACRLLFDAPIASFAVHDYATDPRFPTIGSRGCTSIRLWSREWGGSWTVDVTWDSVGDDGEERGLDGKVVCLWSDANDARREIPAFHEVGMFMPRWSTVTKLSDGLVEGAKVFKI